MTDHRVSVIRTPHTAEPCYGQCHVAVQSAVGEAEAVAAERQRIKAAVAEVRDDPALDGVMGMSWAALLAIIGGDDD